MCFACFVHTDALSSKRKPSCRADERAAHTSSSAGPSTAAKHSPTLQADATCRQVLDKHTHMRTCTLQRGRRACPPTPSPTSCGQFGQETHQAVIVPTALGLGDHAVDRLNFQSIIRLGLAIAHQYQHLSRISCPLIALGDGRKQPALVHLVAIAKVPDASTISIIIMMTVVAGHGDFRCAKSPSQTSTWSCSTPMASLRQG